jgi:hypothetical protein
LKNLKKVPTFNPVAVNNHFSAQVLGVRPQGLGFGGMWKNCH